MPRISVIIPAYHHEKYIAAAIESILAQSFSDFEIVAIDDGSPDRTGEILDSCARRDDRIRVFHQENRGVAETSNRGIEYARGEWVAFCGSDDTYPPGALEALIRKSENVDVVIGEYSCLSDRGLCKRVRYPCKKSSFTELMFASGAMWGKLFRREFLMGNGLRFPKLAMEEDVVFIARMAVLRPRFSLVRRSVYCYWSHDGDRSLSLTHRNDVKSFEERLKGKQMMLDIFYEHRFLEEWETHFISSALLLSDYLLGIFQPRERERAFELFRNFLFQYDWSGREEKFRGYFGLLPEEMTEDGLELFYQKNMQYDWKDRVYHKFATGQIGLRYILKYLDAWAKYKLSAIKEKRSGNSGD